jgi:hypothetical protein
LSPEESLSDQNGLEALKDGLRDIEGPLTIADAAEKSGLSLREAERGLHALISEYRGHLAATENGELLFSFPTGFKKPWERTSKIKKFFGRIKRGIVGVGKFIVRAWISVVLIGYVVGFAALLIALTFAGRGDRDLVASSSFMRSFVSSSMRFFGPSIPGHRFMWAIVCVGAGCPRPAKRARPFTKRSTALCLVPRISPKIPAPRPAPSSP